MQCIIQKKETHILCHDGIIAIIYYLCITTICFSLKFILGDKCNVLIIQMHFAHSHYAKVGKAAGEQLKRQIEQQRQNKTNDDKA